MRQCPGLYVDAWMDEMIDREIVTGDGTQQGEKGELTIRLASEYLYRTSEHSIHIIIV